MELNEHLIAEIESFFKCKFSSITQLHPETKEPMRVWTPEGDIYITPKSLTDEEMKELARKMNQQIWEEDERI